MIDLIHLCLILLHVFAFSREKLIGVRFRLNTNEAFIKLKNSLPFTNSLRPLIFSRGASIVALGAVLAERGDAFPIAFASRK